MRNPRVCIVAIPLSARSGVYRSAEQTVRDARSRGLDWTAVVGLRSASGLAAERSDEVLEEVNIDGESPWKRYSASISVLRKHPRIRAADIIISFIPFTDVYMSFTRRTWVAFVRGLPWPDRGETSTLRRQFWRTLESSALRRAREVWATTSILAAQIETAVSPHIVPAGIDLAQVPRVTERGNRVVWAGRYAIDKNPQLFVQAMAGVGYSGVMYGTGVLEGELRASAPSSVEVRGWTAPEELWDDAAIFVGTSPREAFGRSAVEAAAAGVPVVIGDSYGCADLLYTDEALHSRFVLPQGEPERWTSAIQDLMEDPALYASTSRHIQENAHRLSVAASVDAILERLRRIEGS